MVVNDELGRILLILSLKSEFVTVLILVDDLFLLLLGLN